MKIKRSVTAVLSLALLVVAGGSGCVSATETPADGKEVCLIALQDVPRMTVDELNSRLDDPTLVIIDVRSPGDWNPSSTKIKGAIREVLEKAEEWAPRYGKEKKFVFYCS